MDGLAGGVREAGPGQCGAQAAGGGVLEGSFEGLRDFDPRRRF